MARLKEHRNVRPEERVDGEVRFAVIDHTGKIVDRARGYTSPQAAWRSFGYKQKMRRGR